ncbi:MAG: AbrB/MazE/SpoVT family DNA-binding domain-containing protein [Candidatus Wallbacteria bacterium]|nr:AbrB/MazE/SpoVT family DNA-binding domain-containing protein [Candidatus Wallbacteria bacterium]
MRVTVSPKYQIAIPRSVRTRLNLKPGQKLEIIAYDNRLEFIPVPDIKELRGSLKGIDTAVERRDRL